MTRSMRHEISSSTTYRITQTNNYRFQEVRFSTTKIFRCIDSPKVENFNFGNFCLDLVSFDAESAVWSECVIPLALRLINPSEFPVFCFQTKVSQRTEKISWLKIGLPETGSYSIESYDTSFD